MLKEITTIIETVDDSKNRIISPKLIYNDKFLLSLILKWFVRQSHLIVNSDLDRKICKACQLIDGSRFYINATIETPFKVRKKGEKDVLAEASATVSGAVGHFSIRYGKKKEKLILLPDAGQFVILETTMIKPLKKGGKNMRKYHQIAKDIGCMVHTLSQIENKFLDYLGLYVFAPETVLQLETFKTYTYKPSIEELMVKRVEPYGDDEDKLLFIDLFRRLFQRIDIDCISFEDIIRFIKKNDAEYGDNLLSFYDKCLRYHGLIA